ncbi:22494_t:CDS:1 [Entrophospora sp. SA101]|nr:4767_t:CDS:1 [Entrophospora sp. SA101]CAJ0767601.1 22494_t:CDS:1 [Entrophospora sp. SA101]CAJ0904818.1 10361_t:CDS:1 [Entrophospora sp. SA101]CAJ0912813.1 10364_t:CDS:1 [Entrophospora sp. SA101]
MQDVSISEELRRRKSFLQIAGTACNNCRKTGEEAGVKGLLRCTRCRMFYYCSKECQKIDFSFHKRFCQAISDLSDVEEAWYSCNGEQESWNKRKLYQMQLLSDILDRDLDDYERNAWLNQPKCSVCFISTRETNESLIACPSCKVVLCCSKEHWTVYKQKHSKLCKTYQNMVECEKIRYLNGDSVLWVPEDWDEERKFPPLPKNWNEYLQWRNAPNSSDKNSYSRVVTNSLSMPLTILSAFERFYNRDQLISFEELSIHVIGANFTEVVALMTFEEIMHVLPNIKILHIVLIGTELQMNKDNTDLTCCPKCTDSNRKRLCSMKSILYHDYVGSSDYAIPNLGVAFNTGLHEEDTDLWKPTIECLLEKNLPCVFTSYSKEEASEDIKVLKSLGAKIISGAKENKWRSTMPIVEPNVLDKFFYNNFYRTFFQGKMVDNQ